MTRLAPWRDFDREPPARHSPRPGLFRSWLAAFLILGLAGGVSACLFGLLIFCLTAMAVGP